MAQLRARLAVFVRQRRGALPQRAFARKTGLAQSTIMRIENQEQNVTLDTLEQLCRVFHVDISELFPQRAGADRYPWQSPGAAQQAGMIHERAAQTPGISKRSGASADQEASKKGSQNDSVKRG